MHELYIVLSYLKGNMHGFVLLARLSFFAFQICAWLVLEQLLSLVRQLEIVTFLLSSSQLNTQIVSSVYSGDNIKKTQN